MTNTFRLPNIDFAYAEVDVLFETNQDGNVIAINDITYDNRINFNTLVKSENELLNIPPEDYVQDLEFPLVEIALGSRFGEWEFNQDPFGNSVNIVKTVKLSGKGYNIKTVFVDFTKSKWTLETMGIAYKMRRARSG
jgi:hypothetical protein